MLQFGPKKLSFAPSSPTRAASPPDQFEAPRTALPRGAVVSRRAVYGLVWSHDPTGLVLLQILPVENRRLCNVLLSMGELLACGTPIAHHAAVVIDPVRHHSADGQEQVGTAPTELVRRIEAAIDRMADEIRHHDKWAGDRHHRGRERQSVWMAG